MEFGRSGHVHSRAEILAAAESTFDAGVRDLAAHPHGADVVLVTYLGRVRREGACVGVGRRSSIWTRAGDRWQLRFHQGTPADRG